MKGKVFSVLVVVALFATLAFPQANVAAAPPAPALSVPVTGTTDAGDVFVGTFELQRFAVQNGELVAIGTVSGTLTDALGGVVGSVSDVRVTMPVTDLSSTCQVLDLSLGPLDLDLLGLVVHLDEVNLDITAVSGSGNLLGNLLCAITRLLDGGGALTAVTNLLNAILGALG